MSERQEYIWDDRAPAFRLLADGVVFIAGRSGIEIDSTTYDRCSDIGGLIREIDTLRDDYGVPSEELLQRLESYEEFEAPYPHLAPGVLEDEKREELLRTARNLFYLGKLAALATNPEEYAPIRFEEAATTARLVTAIATDHVTQQEAYESEFVPNMRKFFVGVTFFDSFLDGRIDYRLGKTSVEPTRHYYSQIREVGRTGMRYTLGLMRYPTIPKLTAKMAYRRIKTRVIHGMTPYSTMQNVPDFFRSLRHPKRRQD